MNEWNKKTSLLNLIWMDEANETLKNKREMIFAVIQIAICVGGKIEVKPKKHEWK